MNDAYFEKALSQTLKNEGVVNGKTGYVNDKNDSGGETNYGITAAKARECGYQGKMNALPFYLAKEIYYQEYWKKTNANNITNFNISFLLFDFAVNTGVKNAVKKIQKVFNEKYGINPILVIDGFFGYKTLNAFNTLQSYKKDNEFIFIEFERYYIAEILEYYTSLSKFKIYGKGWINRVKNNIEFLANG